MDGVMREKLSSARLLTGLKAAGEATRLRLLALLAGGELNVKDLTRVLGQSQPRISRHLKLLIDAGLIERFREGSWVYFRLSEGGPQAELARMIIEATDAEDPVLERDRSRAELVKRERAEAAQAYFRTHAGEWDRIRSLHLAEEQVEAEMLEAMGRGPFDLLVDMGTGTGRTLELFAGLARRGVGYDLNRDMLAYARGKLERSGHSHCQVRQGNLLSLALEDGVADGVVLHQVLHFLDDPAPALTEAARILAPGGRLVIVDFSPHALEFLRDDFAHRRLGIEPAQMARWAEAAGLKIVEHRELRPDAVNGPDKLTVSLWVATGTQPANEPTIRAEALEAAN
jgi:ubiquinone/menaquinone biosynthesis C-methylase UbiE/DNA-binding transcriptional ArsR family regulator